MVLTSCWRTGRRREDWQTWSRGSLVLLANYMLQQTGATDRWVVRDASGIDWYASRALHGKAPCS